MPWKIIFDVIGKEVIEQVMKQGAKYVGKELGAKTAKKIAKQAVKSSVENLTVEELAYRVGKKAFNKALGKTKGGRVVQKALQVGADIRDIDEVMSSGKIIESLGKKALGRVVDPNAIKLGKKLFKESEKSSKKLLKKVDKYEKKKKKKEEKKKRKDNKEALKKLKDRQRGKEQEEAIKKLKKGQKERAKAERAKQKERDEAIKKLKKQRRNREKIDKILDMEEKTRGEEVKDIMLGNVAEELGNVPPEPGQFTREDFNKKMKEPAQSTFVETFDPTSYFQGIVEEPEEPRSADYPTKEELLKHFGKTKTQDKIIIDEFYYNTTNNNEPVKIPGVQLEISAYGMSEQEALVDYIYRFGRQIDASHYPDSTLLGQMQRVSMYLNQEIPGAIEWNGTTPIFNKSKMMEAAKMLADKARLSEAERAYMKALEQNKDSLGQRTAQNAEEYDYIAKLRSEYPFFEEQNEDIWILKSLKALVGNRYMSQTANEELDVLTKKQAEESIKKIDNGDIETMEDLGHLLAESQYYFKDILSHSAFWQYFREEKGYSSDQVKKTMNEISDDLKKTKLPPELLDLLRKIYASNDELSGGFDTDTAMEMVDNFMDMFEDIVGKYY